MAAPGRYDGSLPTERAAGPAPRVNSSAEVSRVPVAGRQLVLLSPFCQKPALVPGGRFLSLGRLFFHVRSGDKATRISKKKETGQNGSRRNNRNKRCLSADAESIGRQRDLVPIDGAGVGSVEMLIRNEPRFLPALEVKGHSHFN